MGILIYGTQSTPIGIDEQFVRCPSCEHDANADIMVQSTYFHFYFLPLFPVSKEVNIICKKCGLKRYGSHFNAENIKNYEEIKGNFHHPWYSYIFITLVSILILLGIIL